MKIFKKRVHDENCNCAKCKKARLNALPEEPAPVKEPKKPETAAEKVNDALNEIK